MQWPLEFKIHAECSLTRARYASLILPNNTVPTPIFMPVATSAVMKGVTVSQLEELSVPLILNNTYHLALNPGQKLLDSYSSSRKLMGWKRAMLTDSGGFQMVSLAKLSTVSEG
jgi:tRNA-guanine family transglycosylase